MTNYYNSLCNGRDTVHKKSKFGASGGSPNTTKTSRWWLASLFMVMSLFMGQLSFGQTGTIQIGSGTSTNTQMPIYSCYGYNYTQQIVTSAEYLAGGGIAGDITKLRFYYNASGTTVANWNNWTVYMGHTSKTSFTSTTDWVPSASMTQVFTGTIAPVAGNWFEMTLSSPFTYDGTSNIVVAVDENASSYSCTASFRSYSSATNTAIYYYSDGTNPNPASPPTASGRTGTLAQIQFFGAVASCFTPTGITASSVTNTSASLSWTAPSSGTAPSGYEYEVRTSGAAGSGSTGLVASGSPTTNSASVSALTSNTSYSVYVRSFCGGSDYSAWTSAATFKTLCDAISTLPFTENFDTVTAPALPSCWTKNDVNADGDSWITYTGYSNSGTTSAGLYTDGNSGSNNDYLILPTITLTGNQRLVYYVRARSASEPNDYTVKLSTTDTAPASFTNTLLPLTSVSSVTYTKVQIDLSAYSGNVNIAFHVPSGGLDGWYLYIDDVTVENNPSCFETTGLAVSSVTNNSASLAWSGPTSGTTPIGYEYEVRTSGAAGSGATGLAFSGNPTTNSASLTGLSANTPYAVYVRTQCSASEFSVWTLSSNFKTLCDPITTLPYTENFDTVTTPALPSCWTQNNANADGDSWITYTGYSNSGTTSAGLLTDFNSGSNNDYLISPTITLTGNQRLVYYVRARSAGEPNDYTVKLSTSGTSPASFTNTLLPLTTVSSITYTKVQIDLSAYSGNVNIAFHVPSGGLDGYYLYIDDVTVENNPACFEPTAVSVSAITSTSATVSWTAPTSGTTTSYEYVVSTSNTAPTGAGNSNAGTSVGVSGLTANTTYYAFVRTFCGGSDYSVWTLATTFTTPCDATNVPYVQDFESVITPALPSCSTSQNAGSGNNWTTSSPGANGFTSKTLTYAYSSNAAAAWFYTQGLNLTAGKSYIVSYRYGNNSTFYTEKLKVAFGTATVNTAMTNIIADYPSITSAASTTASMAFSPSATGVYYIGFNAYSNSGQYNLYVDDISVTELPDCSGTPNTGVAVIPSASGCSGLIMNLSATGLTTGSGISYQWQSSPDDSSWTDISGATNATYSLTTTSGLTYYRVNTICTPASTNSSSSSVSYTGTTCTYDTTRSTGVTYTSIMPANGGAGLAFSGWQGTTGDDNVSTTQSLAGTTFTYQGQAVTGMQACSNGWMTFNTANTSSAYDNNLTGATPIKVLAPFWDDLVFTAQSYANRDNSVRYKVDGTLGSGSAVITVEWAGIERYNIPGPNLNFQVKLFESDNHIEYIYGTFEGFDGSVPSAYSYSIGMNGSNPAGISTVDHLVLQTPNENHFGATNNTNQIIMPTCNTMYSFVPGVYSGLTSAPAAVAPANDNSAGATSITVLGAPATSYCGTYYNSRNATDSGAGLPTCLTTALTAGDQDDDVWFKFTTTSTTDYVVKLRNAPGYDGVIELLDASLTSISCQNSTGAGLIETINANGLTAGGTTYYLRVFHKGTGVGTSNGEYSLSVSEVIAPPTNDNIDGAVSLTPSINCVTTSSQYPATLSATASTQAVSCSTPDDDVWYSFTATSTGNMITVQSGAGYNATLQVYSSSDNTATGTLTSMTCTNATGTAGVETYSNSTFVVGNTYFVRVYHALAGVGSGNFTICVTSVLSPNCTELTTPANGTTGIAIGTVALAWTAPSADVTHSAAVSYDVYTGTTSGALTLFTNTANTTVNLTGVTYGTYYVRIVPKNAGGPAEGGCTETSFTTIPDPCAGNLPAGDTFATAIDLGTLTNSGATASGDNNTSNCWHNDYTTTSTPGSTSAYGTNDVFYKFVVPDACNTIDIDACTTSFDTYIHLLDSTGARIEGYDQGCSSGDGTYEAGLTLAPGTYYLVLESWSTSATGTYTLDISYTGSAQNTYYVDADGDNYGNSALATVLACTKPIGYALLDGDCDDNNSAKNPGLAEILYNGIDDNCDGQLDEGFERTTALNSSSCSANLVALYTSISAEIKSGVTGYRFEVTNLTNPLAPVQTIDRTVQWFNLTQLASYDYSTTYSIKVMLRVGATWLGYYGDACTVSTPDVSSPTGGSAVVVSPVCGTKLPTVSSHNIYTNLLSGVTGYKYRVTRGTEVQELTRTAHWFRLNQLPNYVYGATYTVEVAFKTTGDYTPYGPACTILAPDAPTITTCGQTTVSGNIYSALLYGVTQYTFEVTNLTNTSEAVQVINRPNHYLPVSLITGYSSANMYSIRVAVTSTGIQSDYGTACEINVPAPTRLSDGNLTSEFKANGFPNPFTNNFTLDITTTSEEKVSVMVYDMIGKLLDRVEVNATDNALELGANYPAGVYNVIVSQGEKIETVRMVKR